MMKQDSIFLAQCDTTAGLLSKNPQILNLRKSRPKSQPLLIESSHLSGLKKLVRSPNKHKNTIRKAKNSTFIYPNGKAVRVVKDELHSRFLQDCKMLYSTSANLTGKSFNKQWAYEVCDIIVCDRRGFSESSPSKMYKINHSKIQRKR